MSQKYVFNVKELDTLECKKWQKWAQTYYHLEYFVEDLKAMLYASEEDGGCDGDFEEFARYLKRKAFEEKLKRARSDSAK